MGRSAIDWQLSAQVRGGLVDITAGSWSLLFSLWFQLTFFWTDWDFLYFKISPLNGQRASCSPWYRLYCLILWSVGGAVTQQWCITNLTANIDRCPYLLRTKLTFSEVAITSNKFRSMFSPFQIGFPPTPVGGSCSLASPCYSTAVSLWGLTERSLTIKDGGNAGDATSADDSAPSVRWLACYHHETAGFSSWPNIYQEKAHKTVIKRNEREPKFEKQTAKTTAWTGRPDTHVWYRFFCVSFSYSVLCIFTVSALQSGRISPMCQRSGENRTLVSIYPHLIR